MPWHWSLLAGWILPPLHKPLYWLFPTTTGKNIEKIKSKYGNAGVPELATHLIGNVL
jgi:hypothetical protein